MLQLIVERICVPKCIYVNLYIYPNICIYICIYTYIYIYVYIYLYIFGQYIDLHTYISIHIFCSTIKWKITTYRPCCASRGEFSDVGLFYGSFSRYRSFLRVSFHIYVSFYNSSEYHYLFTALRQSCSLFMHRFLVLVTLNISVSFLCLFSNSWASFHVSSQYHNSIQRAAPIAFFFFKYVGLFWHVWVFFDIFDRRTWALISALWIWGSYHPHAPTHMSLFPYMGHAYRSLSTYIFTCLFSCIWVCFEMSNRRMWALISVSYIWVSSHSHTRIHVVSFHIWVIHTGFPTYNLTLIICMGLFCHIHLAQVRDNPWVFTGL